MACGERVTDRDKHAGDIGNSLPSGVQHTSVGPADLDVVGLVTLNPMRRHATYRNASTCATQNAAHQGFAYRLLLSS
eukprot:COSAG05_NODE_105_length_18793_cov_115.346421_27_plen_77_part_00